MSKVTSKLQVTIPKTIAEQYGIRPGDEIEFQAAGHMIRVVPPHASPSGRLSRQERLRLFDEATRRQREHEKTLELRADKPSERGWRREDLYFRGEPD